MMNNTLNFQNSQNIQCDAQIVIVGGGMVGLSIAIDLAQRGISIIVLEKRNSVLKASRAICYSKESLSYFEKIGIYNEVLRKGVKWSLSLIHI